MPQEDWVPGALYTACQHLHRTPSPNPHTHPEFLSGITTGRGLISLGTSRDWGGAGTLASDTWHVCPLSIPTACSSMLMQALLLNVRGVSGGLLLLLSQNTPSCLLAFQSSCPACFLTIELFVRGQCLWDDSRALHSVVNKILFLPFHVSSVAAYKLLTITELSSCGREHMVSKPKLFTICQF